MTFRELYIINSAWTALTELRVVTVGIESLDENTMTGSCAYMKYRDSEVLYFENNLVHLKEVTK